ncbi:phage tail assembly chaperone [Pseudomonas protegens]|uniref:phage tail assembly chaperone n=1 Tax=Pseudomonas protegens TaxID=380021 RepID=UPI0029373C74|nr:phage tail assembly chaperone [Pseudomonas protegens]WOE80794.1 phage tail assembly chaperone [Pseudomonas protegens]
MKAVFQNDVQRWAFGLDGPGAIELTKEEYAALLAAPSRGMEISVGPDGRPALVAPVQSLPERLHDNERAWRDMALAIASGIRDRHRDELELERPTTLTRGQFKELLVYVQALRDWPQSLDFPELEHRPVAPPWIAEQTQ